MSDIPFIDEHERLVAASPGAVWEALRSVLTDRLDKPGGFSDRILRPDPPGPAGPRPLAAGSEMGGFRVVDAVEGERLVLAGSLRVSRYRLELLVESAPEGAMIRARSFGEFPGVLGRLYRALVIGTRGHVLVVRGILRSAAQRAEVGALLDGLGLAAGTAIVVRQTDGSIKGGPQ